jgi:hypothetical protein
MCVCVCVCVCGYTQDFSIVGNIVVLHAYIPQHVSVMEAAVSQPRWHTG